MIFPKSLFFFRTISETNKMYDTMILLHEDTGEHESQGGAVFCPNPWLFSYIMI